MTGFADFLDTAFYGFDSAMFSFWNSLECGFLTVTSDIVSFFGKSGIFMVILAASLLLFKRTRRFGLAIAISIAIGAILTNAILKNVVVRARPYLNPEYHGYWQAVGSHIESDASFPSGHMTSVTAAFLAIFFTAKCKPKFLWTAIPIFLMGVARNYLIVHYATDIIAGFIVGLIASGIACPLSSLIWEKIEKRQNKFSEFILDASITHLFVKK